MRATRRRDTPCELAIRSAVHKQGFRYRVDWNVPGTRTRADLAFVSAQVLVFIDGCFWHGCPKHATWPKANADWWREKIEGNVRRDRDATIRLRRDGWTVLRFWEHEDPERAALRIASTVARRRPRRATLGRPQVGLDLAESIRSSTTLASRITMRSR